MRERAKRAGLVVGFWALFLLLPFVVLWKFAPFVSDKTIGNDYVIYPFDAQLEFIWSWGRGMVPLYVPNFDGGNTAAGMTLGQGWHPITWICAFVPWYSTGGAELVVTSLRLLELGFTHAVLYRVTRQTGLGRAASFVLTLAVVFNGRMLDSFRYGSSLEGFCGMLLMCAAFASAYMKGWSFKRVTLAAFAVYVTLVSGHPQWALFGTTGAGLFALCLPLVGGQLAVVPTARDRWWKYLAGLGGACILGVILAAGYVLPFMREFMSQNGERVNQAYSFTVGYGDTVRGTISNFVRPLEADVHGSFGGNILFLAVVLSVPVLFVTRKRFAIGVLAPSLLFAVALFFAMGKATPIHRFMVEHLPLFSSFRTPGRATLWIPPMLLVIGWVVFADLERPDVARRWMKIPAIAIGGALSVVGLLLFHVLTYGNRVGDNTPAAIAKVPRFAAPLLLGLAAVGASMLALLAVRARVTRLVTWSILIVSVIAAAAIVLPFGTWRADRKPMRTIEQIDAHHHTSRTFWGDAGYGMAPALVSKARAAKIPAKRELSSVAENARFAATNEEAIAMVKAGLPPGTVVLTSDEISIPAAEGRGKPKSQPTRINWNRWSFVVQAPRGGVFVFGQPALKEWSARVDGNVVPILTANAVFAAVVLEPGEHDVEFRYESKSTLMGGLLFFVGLALILAVNGFFTGWRAKTKRARVLWWIGAALSIGLVVTVGVFWHKGLTPSLNLLDPLPPKSAPKT